MHHIKMRAITSPYIIQTGSGAHKMRPNSFLSGEFSTRQAIANTTSKSFPTQRRYRHRLPNSQPKFSSTTPYAFMKYETKRETKTIKT